MRPSTPVIGTTDPLLVERIYAKDQPQYRQLPCIASQDGRLTTRWSLTWHERLRLLFSGNLWLQILTFNQPLQPVKILTEEPRTEDCL